MPIDFFDADDGTHIRQSFDSPSIYLDHWAIRLFSDDLLLQERLITALKLKQGTLLISIISLLEFCRPEDPRHCLDTEKFFNRLMPNIFFTDFAIDKDHHRESLEKSNEKRFWPSADLRTLKYLAEYKRDIAGNISILGFLSAVYENRSNLLSIEEDVISMLQEAFITNRSDPSYVKKAKAVQPSNERTRTFNIMGELMRRFNLDPKLKITKNDIIDLIHATSPINCCDYVLLDSHWEERVKKMNNRIAKTDMYMPIAKCFSKKNEGVKKFLSELESFDKNANSTAGVRP